MTLVDDPDLIVIELTIETLGELADEVRSFGAEPLVENMPDHSILLGTSADEMEEIFRASGYGFTDVGHALTAEGSLRTYLQPDLLRSRQLGRWRQAPIVRDEILDFEELRRALHQRVLSVVGIREKEREVVKTIREIIERPED
ncbi:hypothetical protein [Methanopyrus sp. KOL6]|uniref:hypothetical protein n=1 Tax=Methanopyrus sp. KOL6 TaxID=1937004 RepID=UPI000B4A66DA|nr:hypothetical protein [Methanopyrus sp. KOL6]